MALFAWKTLNSNIIVRDIKKKLFNRYYYSMKYHCPGARIILVPGQDNYESIKDAIDRRKHPYKFSHVEFSWPNVSEINPDQLIDVLNTKNKHALSVKIRIVEPYVTVYATTEEALLQIAQTDLIQWTKKLTEICRPNCNATKNVLDSNAILVKANNGYRYKFMCKEGMCQNKVSIYSYLDQLNDQVKLSKTVWTQLESTSPYIRGIWFYANDLHLAQFLNIIEPNFVTNIHELVVS